jgi:ParB/RepB/Spo0J family partition protein
MPRKLDYSTRRFEGLLADPRDVVAEEADNGRAYLYTQDDTKDIVRDLELGLGIKQPVSGRAIKDQEGKLTASIVAGYRRWAAAKLYVEKHKNEEGFDPRVLPILFVDPKDELEIFRLNVRENTAKKDLTQVDKADIVDRFFRLGFKDYDIAEELGCSLAQVGQYKKIHDLLGEKEKKALHNGTMAMDAALTLVKMREDEAKGKIEAGTTDKLVDEVLVSEDSGSEEKDSSNGDEEKDSSNEPKSLRVSTQEIKERATQAGTNVGAMRMAEFKKYLQQAIDEEGPGSNKGEVALKQKMLDFIARKIGEKSMDNAFNTNCKSRG